VVYFVIISPANRYPWRPDKQFVKSHLLIPLTVAGFILILLERTGMDLWLADQWFAWEGGRWSLRHNWLTYDVIHHFGKQMIITFALGLLCMLVISMRVPRFQMWRWPLGYVLTCMVLLTHDRDIGDDSPTSTLVPGAGSITFSNSAPDDDVRVHTPGTLIVNGPGGIIDDSTLDTGNASYHGTVTASTLPADGIVHLSRQADSGDGVTVEWPYGSGLVIYSGIPLDCYQTGEDCDWDLAYTDDPYFKYVYTPNMVAYALNPTGRFQPESVPMLDKSGLILLAGLLVLLSVVRIRRIRARI
jgi:hypothetical protein